MRYLVQIGEVFQSQYQIIAEMGYGTAAIYCQSVTCAMTSSHHHHSVNYGSHCLQGASQDMLSCLSVPR